MLNSNRLIATTLLSLTLGAALLIAVAFWCPVVQSPQRAFAQDVVDGESGTCMWKIDQNGLLTIEPKAGAEGTLADWGNDRSSIPWLLYSEDITSARFVGHITAPSCASMFQDCSRIVDIDLSGLDTADTKSTACMFLDCMQLTTIDLTPLETSKAQSLNEMFRGCSSLVELDVSHLDTSSAESIGGMFSDCSSLKLLDLSNLDTSRAIYMWAMFRNCSVLESLDVSTFNTSRAVNMRDMFQGCASLTSLDLRSFDTSKVTDLSGMFWGCSSLTKLDLSSFATSKTNEVDYMFFECASLKTIYVGIGWTSRLMSGDWYVFTGCTSLVGGSGTRFNAAHTGAEYARVDAPWEPGYLTGINGAEPRRSANTLVASGKTVKVKYKKLKKHSQKIAAAKAFSVSRAQGAVSYVKLSGSKKVKVSRSGLVTVTRNGLKKGRAYKVKVRVSAAGGGRYKAGSKTVTLAIKVR